MTDRSAQMFRVGEVCVAADVTRKALRGYEEHGLLAPARHSNGYRLYDEHQLRVVKEIRTLSKLGIPLRSMAPFVDCLDEGGDFPDDCPASLVEYRRAIDQVDDSMQALNDRRESLVRRLGTASRRMVPAWETADGTNPFRDLPEGLPAPVDDGAAGHLIGMPLSGILGSTDGRQVDLTRLGPGRSVIYVFPMTGGPDHDLPHGWDTIPGARGCTPQSCDMRDHYADLVSAGARRVFGLSAQGERYQQALAEALRLPYALLTDPAMTLAESPGLPTFEAGDLTLYRRLTMIVCDRVIEHVFYPVFPPDQHAEVVLSWLRQHPE